MRERHVRRKPGDVLTAKDVNQLGNAAKQVSGASTGSFVMGVNTPTIMSHVAPPPWVQRVLIVVGPVEEETSENSADSSGSSGSSQSSYSSPSSGDGAAVDDEGGVYLCNPRFYVEANDEWYTDETTEWIIDTRDLGLTLSEGDKVVGWWDEQRDAFVPAGGGKGSRASHLKFTLTTELLETGENAQATVDRYWGGEDPDPDDDGLTVWNEEASTNYIFSGVVGHKGMAQWDDRLEQYRIYQMECP